MNLSKSHRHRGWAIASLVIGLACGPDAGDTGGGTDGSSTGGSTTGGSSPTSTMSGPATTVASSSADGTSTGPQATTDVPPGDTTAMGSSGEATGSSSGTTGGPPVDSYPPCMPGDTPCTAPYDQCVTPGMMGNWCTFGCMDAAECPPPSSGTAEPACGGPPGQDTVCQLDCSMGDCPDGMECIGLGPGGQVQLCVWPN